MSSEAPPPPRPPSTSRRRSSKGKEKIVVKTLSDFPINPDTIDYGMDLGTRLLKLGQYNRHCSFIPTVVGYGQGQIKEKKTVIGHTAENASVYIDLELSKVVYPVIDGCVADWDAMSDILVRMSDEVYRHSPEQMAIACIVPVYRPKAQTMKLAEILFETVGLHAFSAVSAPRACHGMWNQDVVVDVGFSHTTVSVYDDNTREIESVTVRSFGGRDVENRVLAHLATKAVSVSSHKALADVKNAIRSYSGSIPAMGIDDVYLKQPEGVEVTIDGAKVAFSWEERLHVGNALIECGLVELIEECISKAPTECREGIWKSGRIAFLGGVTVFAGLGQRIQSELMKVAPEGARFRVVAGSMMAGGMWAASTRAVDLSHHEKLWTTNAAYKELGLIGFDREELEHQS